MVTGRHTFTRRPLRDDCAIPNLIRAFISVRSRDRNSYNEVVCGGNGNGALYVDIPLYDGDNNSGVNRPVWKEHPTIDVCDIAAIDITRWHRDFRPGDVEFEYEGDAYIGESLYHEPVEARLRSLRSMFAGGRGSISLESPLSYDSELVISGFPKVAIAPSPVFPLLKRGVVASPPGSPLIYQDKELPAFYADVMTRPGFSGSPVFFRHTALNMQELPVGSDYHSRVPIPTHATQEYNFVGIYSSRVPEDETKEAIFGMCWHHEAIKSVCENVERSENPALLREEENDSA